jgi:hypothetical protein
MATPLSACRLQAKLMPDEQEELTIAQNLRQICRRVGTDSLTNRSILYQGK